MSLTGNHLRWAVLASCVLHVLALAPTRLAVTKGAHGGARAVDARLRLSPAATQSGYEVPVTRRADETAAGRSAGAGDERTAGPGQAPSLLALTLHDYLPVSQLTTPPHALDSVDPTPPDLRFDGVLGEIELMLLISSDGRVDEVLLLASSLPDTAGDYVRRAFARVHFAPGRVNDVAVRSRLRIVVAPSGPSPDNDVPIPHSVKSWRS